MEICLGAQALLTVRRGGGCSGWFAPAAVFPLGVQIPPALTCLAVFVTGFSVFSGRVLLHVSRHYPTRGRGTALGWATGSRRIGAICGPLLGAGLAVPWGFFTFVGLLGASFAFAVPRSPVDETRRTGVYPEAARR